MNTQGEASKDGGDRRRASLASRLPRLRVSSQRSGSNVSTPTSPVEVAVRVDTNNMSKTNGHSRTASKLHAAPASGHCERCGKPFSVLRRASVCCQCAQRVCTSCLAPASSRSPPVTSPTPPPPSSSPAKKPAFCAECAKIGVFERQLAKSFFSTTLSTNGKRALYPGLSRACYRQWFHERCARASSHVRATEKKRARVIRKLHDRQLLHSPRWIEPCLALRHAFTAAVSYVSLASDAFELIVGGCGDMLHFSCFPREIGMCDQVLGSTEPVLVLYDATDRSASRASSMDSGLIGIANTTSKAPVVATYRHNPFLVLAKAGFYAARSIIVDGVGIGIVALLDPQPRTAPLTDEELNILASACKVISERVTRIVAPSRPASSPSPTPSKTVATPKTRCMAGICATPSIR